MSSGNRMFVIRVLFGAFSMAVGLYIIFVLVTLFITGSDTDSAVSILDRYELSLFFVLFLISIPIVFRLFGGNKTRKGKEDPSQRQSRDKEGIKRKDKR